MYKERGWALGTRTSREMSSSVRSLGQRKWRDLAVKTSDCSCFPPWLALDRRGQT